ncbi:Kelch domain-containing protein 7A, partial [Dryobates pubescens]
LSITSGLGLTMTASNAGSDASYSFSSVAKIQVEENYITERRVKAGAGQTVPGLRGKVYDYYVQSISQSVVKKRPSLYTPPGTSQHRRLESDPAPAPAPRGSWETPSEPPSPGRKVSILQIADSPHLQLPMEGFGVTAEATTPPASPQAGLGHDADFFQTWPAARLDLGNCYEVLCAAKARKLGELQEAAYQVMSDNYLQVLRTPAIYGRCLCTVERYDPRRDRWSFAAPLPRDTFAVAHAAAACQGEIYVTGGTLRSLLLRYAARTDSWSLGLAGGGKERTVEMVSTDGFLYRFDLHPSAGIGVYRCGAKAKLWYQCAAYPLPDLPGFQCAVLGSLVHCVGRHFHLRFLADHVSPRFGAKELQPFPEPRGSLFPAVLVLPEGGRAQTEV